MNVQQTEATATKMRIAPIPLVHTNVLVTLAMKEADSIVQVNNNFYYCINTDFIVENDIGISLVYVLLIKCAMLICDS